MAIKTALSWFDERDPSKIFESEAACQRHSRRLDIIDVIRARGVDSFDAESILDALIAGGFIKLL